jgi:DNA-binding beta-propeller fold protein YncE
MNKEYIKPEDVSPQDSQKVLDFLNNAKSAEEINVAVEIPDERDVGVKVSQRILDMRNKLGSFVNLQQVADVPYVGPERFTEIIQTLTKKETGETPLPDKRANEGNSQYIGEYPVLVIEIIPNEGSEYNIDIYDQLKEAVRKCSYGQTEIVFDKAGPYVAASPFCNEQDGSKLLITFALNMAQSHGFDLNNYRHFMFVVDRNLHALGCGSAGHGAYGTFNYTGIELTAGFVTLFCFNDFSANYINDLGWVFHEFLHGFGYGTSHTSVLLSSINEIYEPYFYNDPQENILLAEFAVRSGPSYLDVMGWVQAGGALNSIVRYQYGWLNASHLAIVTQGENVQIYDLYPVDSETLIDNMIYMIQMPIPDSTKAYILEYRINPPIEMNPGVFLYIIPDKENLSYEEQYLLRTDRPSINLTISEKLKIPPITVGEVTVIDPKINLSVKVVKIEGGKAQVEVMYSKVVKGTVFWTDNSSDSILHAKTDNPITETLLSTGPGMSGPTAITYKSGKLYWGDFIKNKISRSNIDGSSREDIIFNVDSPFGLVIDEVNKKIYWTNQSNKTISRADLNGNNVEIIRNDLGGVAGRGIVDLDINLNEQKIYWTELSERNVLRMDLDGSNVEIIVSLPVGCQPTGIVVDPGTGKIYWSDFTMKKISRCNLDGSNIEDIFTISENSNIGRIAIDLKGKKLYFDQTVYSSNPFTIIHKIKQMNFDGSDIQTIIDNTGEVGGLVFVADN